MALLLQSNFIQFKSHFYYLSIFRLASLKLILFLLLLKVYALHFENYIFYFIFTVGTSIRSNFELEFNLFFGIFNLTHLQSYNHLFLQ